MTGNQPHPPGGFQRPGIPGAGNLLDPTVRGQLREQIHEAAHGAREQVQQQPSEQSNEAREESSPARSASKEAPASSLTPRPSPHAPPYPHGDVDLSHLAANVPPEPVTPKRGKAGRRFYFLPEDAKPGSDNPHNSLPAPTPPANPKPG